MHSLGNPLIRTASHVRADIRGTNPLVGEGRDYVRVGPPWPGMCCAANFTGCAIGDAFLTLHLLTDQQRHIHQHAGKAGYFGAIATLGPLSVAVSTHQRLQGAIASIS